METILIIIWVVFLFFTVASYYFEWNEVVVYIIFLVFCTFSVVCWEYIGYKQGCEDTLKGRGRFKMEIRYELRDSIYVPIDTLIVRNIQR